MAYTKKDWEAYPSTATPITAEALNKIEQGIEDAHTGNAYQYGGVGFKNYIINGGFDVWQRGIGAVSSGYSADRWLVVQGAHSFQANTTGSPDGFKYNMLIRRDVSGTVVAGQRIEASSAIRLNGKDITISFYHSVVSGTVSNGYVEIKYATVEDDFTSTTQIAITSYDASTSGVKTVTFTNLPSNVANGLQLNFTYVVTGDTSVRLARVQLEEGDVATPFEQRPYGLELSLCQRYCEKIRLRAHLVNLYGTGNYTNIIFKTEKRTTTYDYTIDTNVTNGGAVHYSGGSQSIIGFSDAGGDPKTINSFGLGIITSVATPTSQGCGHMYADILVEDEL